MQPKSLARASGRDERIHFAQTRKTRACACNYQPNAGPGARTVDASDTWRAALLGTVAAGALVFGYGRRAYAQVSPPTAPCDNVVGTTATCTGNVSGGVSAVAPYSVLNVNNLTANILPTANIDGISFTNNTAGVTINSNTGAYNIQVSGTGRGIEARSVSGAVTINSTGNVTSSNSLGILASANGAGNASITSVGDVSGGPNGIYATSNSGDVSIESTGDVTATGGYAVGTSTTSTSTVTLHSGTVSGNLVGVRFFGAGTNTLNNAAVLSGGNNAVQGSTGNDTINNTGTITGTIDLSTGTNAFNNQASGTFRSGATVNLGAGNTLTNAGTLSPGNTGTAQVTALTGNLVQTGDGTFTVDIDEGAGTPADRVNASGTATFAGTVVPNVINITSETGSVVIASATTLTNTATVTDVGDRDFSLSVQANQLLLSWAPAQATGILVAGNANQQAIATYLNAANAAGPNAGLQALIDSLIALGEPELLAALNQLLPSLYSDAQIAALYSSLGFTDSLLSCKVNGPDTASIIREGQCLWAGASATFLDSSTTFSQLGFSGTTGSFAAGAQVALDHVWRLGFGAGYQQTTLSSATNATSDGQQGQVGATLKYNPGAFLAAAAISGGRGWYDTTRPVAFTGFSGTATSDSQIGILNGGLRLAYVFGTPHLYFKPVLDAAATRLDLSGFTESGGGAANLSVRGRDQTVYTIAPSLEIGTEWWWPNGTLVRPFLRGGVTWYENADLALSASFVGAPAGVAPFTILNDIDDVMGTVGAGIDVITADDTVLNVTYDGQLGDTTQIHSVALKGSVRF